jgi:hypothetical protein
MSAYRVIENGSLIYAGNDYRQALTAYMDAIKRGGKISDVSIWGRDGCINSH